MVMERRGRCKRGFDDGHIDLSMAMDVMSSWLVPGGRVDASSFDRFQQQVPWPFHGDQRPHEDN